MIRRAALAGALLCLVACRREEAPPPPERTLEKLKVEVDRANAGGAVAKGPDAPEDPNQNLAALAAGVATERGPEGPLTLPTEGTTATANAIALEVRSAQTAHQVKGKSMSLTTEELFLEVALTARNTGKAAAHFSIERAAVSVPGAEGEWRMARDAQVLAGTRELGFDLAPGQEREVTLMFEVPPSAVSAPQLVLSLPQPQGGNGDARLRLK